jgi:hypothetical protein
VLVARAEIARQSQSIVCSDVDRRSSDLTGHASTALYSVVLNAEQMPSQNEPGIRASVRHRNQELVYKRESIDLGAVTIARVCEGCELVRLEHRQSSGGAYQRDQRHALTSPRCAKAKDTERMVAVQNPMLPACCLVLTVSERQSARQLRARVNRNVRSRQVLNQRWMKIVRERCWVHATSRKGLIRVDR